MNVRGTQQPRTNSTSILGTSKMSQSIRNKVILVTGASSGIGRAIARLFSAEGANLCLAARSTDKLETLAHEIGGAPLVFTTNLAKSADVHSMIERTLEKFGRIDVLIANAGLYLPGLAAEGDADAWDTLLAVNVNSVFRAIREVLPHMIAQHSGDILVTSSIAGHQVISGEPVYSASKHAVQVFVHEVRRQVAPHNIRVGAVAPGTVLNELWGFREPSDIARKVANREGLRSEDIADACLWMLTRPPHVTIRDIVILPQNQDI